MERFLVSAGTGALAAVTNKLAILLGDEFKNIKGMRKEIKSLSDELNYMHVFLMKMSEEENPDNQDKIWMTDVRKISYDIEDSLDDFMICINDDKSANKKSLLKKCKKLLDKMKAQHRISKAIQEFKTQIKEVGDMNHRYKTGVTSTKDSHEMVDIRAHAIFKDASELVGIDEQRNELINLLTENGFSSQHQAKVISIVGFGGLGKTTLANQVYESLKDKFDCKAFVTVSRTPHMMKVLRTILCDISGQDYNGDMHHLIKKIYDLLQNRRYLIVVDDLWDSKSWETLQNAFIKNSYGSKIITTTRKTEVAESCCSSRRGHIYRLQPLNPKNSRKLFLERIFGLEEGPPYLTEVCDVILKKCDGLPLAIITIAGVRYLIVVDDLWSSQAWDTINYCFPKNSLDSRIITTTRNLALAKKCCNGSSDCIYNVELLNEVDSKKLILDRTFGIGHGCPQHLEDVVAQITRRCCGLPLALVTVPSMLEDKSSKDEWDRLVVSRWSSHPDAKVMRQILNHSYSDLPQHLKACLLDLSIFPEDFKVDEDRLVRRWIAEGYIPEIGFGMEEMARRNINELISRSMVQLLPLVHGAPRCCRLHPVIHDFLVCKSMEDNFFTVVGDQNPPISTNCTVYRRLSVQSSKHDQDLTSYDGMDLSHVRSITVFGRASAAPRLTNLGAVRVLDLEGCVGPVCLDNLDKLSLLRYLSLKGTDVAKLPASLWELRFLKTLLFSCEGMINSIETTTRIAKHCHKLENLATIDLWEHHESFVKDLGDLKDLRMLEITWSFHQCTEGDYRKSLLSSMERWRQLRSLTIHCGVGCCMEFLGSLSHPPELLEKFKVTAGGFVSVPKWIQRLNSLSFLQITICKIETDDLKILRDIPQLESLILGLDFVPREPIVIQSEGFSELRMFSVNCPVPWLRFQAGAMPKLTHLQLEFCSGSTNPESVPFGISNLQRLTEVILLYNQKWCADSSSVRMTVDAVRRQVVKHRNLIDLIINDTKVVYVREVDAVMKRATEIQSCDIGEEIARTTVETTRCEIEIEAECDNIGSTY